jgi:hypothetical protein
MKRKKLLGTKSMSYLLDRDFKYEEKAQSEGKVLSENKNNE